MKKVHNQQVQFGKLELCEEKGFREFCIFQRKAILTIEVLNYKNVFQIHRSYMVPKNKMEKGEG